MGFQTSDFHGSFASSRIFLFFCKNPFSKSPSTSFNIRSSKLPSSTLDRERKREGERILFFSFFQTAESVSDSFESTRIWLRPDFGQVRVWVKVLKPCGGGSKMVFYPSMENWWKRKGRRWIIVTFFMSLALPNEGIQQGMKMETFFMKNNACQTCP